MKCIFKGWLLIALSAGFMCGNALAQSAVEARFVLDDLNAWLPGIFDNEPQIFLEAAFGPGEDGPHKRQSGRIIALSDKKYGENAFYAEWRNGGKESAVARRNLIRLSVDEELRGVRMERLVIEAPRNANVEDVEKWLRRADIQSSDPCPMLWRRGQNNVYADEIRAECEQNGRQDSTNVVLSEEALWILESRIDANGEVLGRKDRIHRKLFRAREMECFTSIAHEEIQFGEASEGNNTAVNPFYMHDRGDTYRIMTEEDSPRTFIFLLRRSMWPSRSGNNFVPLLLLYMYQDEISDENFVGNAWASGDSERVAFSSRGLSARCKVRRQN